MKLVPLLFCAYAAAAEAQPAFPGAPSSSMCSASATRAALVEHKDTQSHGQPDLHEDSPESLEPCLQCGTAQAVLLQAPTCVCRSSVAQSSLLPGLPGTARCAPAALGVAGAQPGPAACQHPGSPNGRQRCRSLAAGEKRAGITHGSVTAWAGTTLLQVGQGSLLSHPPRGLTGPPRFPSPALAKAAPLPVPCGYGLGHLQKEQSVSVSLRSLES